VKTQSGFTLLELLIAGAILVVLLSTLGGMYVSSSRAYETNRAVTEASGQLRTAVQAIQRDFSQAGFAGRHVSAGFEALDFQLGQQVEDSHPLVSLTVRYAEAADDMSATAVTYSVENGILWRQREDSQAQPIAEGVAALAVIGFVSGFSADPSPAPISPQSTKGLELRLTYVQGGAERVEEFTVTRP